MTSYKWLRAVICFIGILGALVLIYSHFLPPKAPTTTPALTYLPLGDSYTIGLGISEEDRLPNLLTKSLNSASIPVTLVANPAVSGFTVRDLINFELPVVEQLKPDFVTVLIGANDCCFAAGIEPFGRDYRELIDKLQALLPKPQNIVLITIPSHTRTPAFPQNTDKTTYEQFEHAYNRIIKEVGIQKNLPVADIYPASQTMTSADDYTVDGFHPSVEGYTKWESVIFPVVHQHIKQLSE